MTISIDGFRTVEDLRREQERPVGGEELDRNAFLRLFTTQLQNQNPLDPLKNEAFVAQLAQFSTLEATYSMSDSLGDFLATQQSERMLRGANLLGRNVYAPDVMMVQTGGKELDGIVNVQGTYDNVRLNVVDATTGEIINRMDLGPQLPGDLPFTWNGGNFQGEPAAAGSYKFLAEGFNGEESFSLSVLAESRIKAVSWNDSMGATLVEIEDGRSIALNDITHISE